MKKLAYSLGAFLIAGTIFFACKKDKKEVDNETQTVADNALCEQEFMRMGPAVSERAVSTPGVKKVLPGFFTTFSTCASDSLTGSTSVDANGNFYTDSIPTLTLDWGTGCVDVDGVSRSGKLSTTFTKPFSKIGSVMTITPIDYKVGNVIYSGVIQVTRLDTGEFSSFRTQVINGHCKTANWDIDWITDKTIRYTAGYNTSTPDDDVIEISGTSSGKNRESRSFSVTVKTPLQKKANCKFISKGSVEIIPDGLKARTVDFGNGDCDNIGTFTVSGNTFTFTMQ
ncbi:MAG TPA: hypothetical protein VGF30_01070 [Bacteroidia bacterium]